MADTSARPRPVAPARYGFTFDGLAARWANLENEHDRIHPERNQCGGVGGCTIMAAAVDLEREMLLALDEWRKRGPV